MDLRFEMVPMGLRFVWLCRSLWLCFIYIYKVALVDVGLC